MEILPENINSQRPKSGSLIEGDGDPEGEKTEVVTVFSMREKKKTGGKAPRSLDYEHHRSTLARSTDSLQCWATKKAQTAIRKRKDISGGIAGRGSGEGKGSKQT